MCGVDPMTYLKADTVGQIALAQVLRQASIEKARLREQELKALGSYVAHAIGKVFK